MKTVALGCVGLCLALVGGAKAYQEAPVVDGGSVVGRVRITGEITPLMPQPVYKEHEQCGQVMADERLVVGREGALRYAVVTLDDVTRGKPLPTTPVVLKNHKCAFVPHVLSATVGQRLDLVNEDPFLHDAHAWLGQQTLFNLAIPRGRTVHHLLDAAGLLHINCNVRHTWMHAYLLVAAHPYHAVTDEDGRFSITDVPPGPHHLRVWHELLGVTEREVVVPSRAPVTVGVDLAGTAAEPKEK